MIDAAQYFAYDREENQLPVVDTCFESDPSPAKMSLQTGLIWVSMVNLRLTLQTMRSFSQQKLSI